MAIMERCNTLLTLSLATLAGCRVVSESARSADGSHRIRIDTTKDVHPIDPRIYGVSYGRARAKGRRLGIDRLGGNNISRYNWRENADNKAKDWYFQSIGFDDPTPAGLARDFVRDARIAGNQVMLTMPMIGWVAKLGPKRARTWSYSVKKYGRQQGSEPQGFPDSGNGIGPDGQPMVTNDPNDANVRADVEFFRPWVAMMRKEFGGIDYWLLDNEPGLWHGTHPDVMPVGIRGEELVQRMVRTARMIRETDPKARICGPEEWGWTGFQHSPHDAWHGAKYGWNNLLRPLPDRKARGGGDFLPWLLRRIGEEEHKLGMRLLDVVTVHYYPQSGEFESGRTDDDMVRVRNQSTRALWDPNYVDKSWINDRVRLIPRLKEWVARNLPGREIGITEYNWGEHHSSGGTSQADILGIFGREGLNIGNRWAYPDDGLPSERAFAMYRTADRGKRGFGDQSVRCVAPDPDTLSAFAAIDTTDGALTVMLVAKGPQGNAVVDLDIAGFSGKGAVGVWRMDADGKIERLPSPKTTKRLELPAPSVTLLRIPAS